ncbi:MAG: hypothetical protein RI973_1114 [Bacteroidota bacterium]|jgi:ABC-type bacteriocin/lantibiotic exporter with double-glycine peptidase domain
MLLNYAQLKQKIRPSLEAWRFLYKMLSKHRFILALGFLLLALVELLNLPNLWLTRYLVDSAISKSQVSELVKIMLSLVFINLFRTLLDYWVNRKLYGVMNQTVAGLRMRLISKVLSFPHHYFMENDRAILHSRVILETDRLSGSLKTIVTKLTANLLGVAILVPVMIYISLPLFIVSMVSVPVFYFINKKSTGKLFRHYQAYRVAMELYSKATVFTTGMVELIKFRSTEDKEKERYKAVVQELRQKTDDRDSNQNGNVLLQGLIIAIFGNVVLVSGGYMVMKGSITLGAMLAFIMASRFMHEKFRGLQEGLPAIIEANEALRVLHQIITDRWEEPYRGVVKPRMDGEIRLDQVSFSYKEKPVLNQVSLALGNQSFVAILGANGSGKTTITRLVLGLYRPHAGTISYDGIQAEALDFRYIRSQTGIVPQHPQLIEGSVLENICYGSGDVSLSEVERVCRMVLADRFIEALPEGYHTNVGENGATLSGGERQKIAFARALLGTPQLLILDEPTNHLDSATVSAIVSNLRNLHPRPSLLLITHDRSIVDIVDEVYVLEKGVLVKKVDAPETARAI